MIRLYAYKLQELALLGLLVLSVLWKGGKPLESTWVLTGVAGYITLAWYWDHMKEKKQTEHHTSHLLWWSAILFVVWTGVSFLFSTTKNYGLDEVLRTGSLILIFLWVTKNRYRDAFGHKLLMTLAALTVASCIVGIPVYILQPVNRFVGMFFDLRFHTDYWPNAWAEFVILGWPTVLYAAWHARSSVPKLLRYAGLGLVIGCLLLSYSRGGGIALAGQLFVLGGVYAWKGKTDIDWKRCMALSALVITTAVATFIAANSMRSRFYDVQSVKEKLTFTAAEGKSSVDERRQFWLQAIALTRQKPLTGWGPYSFRFIQPRMQQHVLATSDHAHNVFLKLAAERGIPAVILYGMLIFGILWYQTTIIDKSKKLTEIHAMPILVCVAISGVIAHNLIDYNLQFVGIVLPVWLLLGLIAKQESSSSGREKHVHRICEVVLACGLLILAFYEGRYLVLSSLGRHAEAAGDARNALSWYELSKDEVFSRDLHLSRTHLLINNNRLNQAQIAIEDYFKQNTEDARAWRLLGDIAFKRGEFDAAVDAYEWSHQLAKYNDISTTRTLAEALLRRGGVEELRERKDEMDDLIVAFADAIQVNAHYIALSTNVEEFLMLTDLLTGIFSEEAPFYEVLAAGADHHARVERGRVEARPPGYLW